MRLAKLTVAGILGVTLAAPVAWAETPVAPGEWFVSGGFGEFRFEGRDIDDEKGGAVLSLGHRFEDWGFEITGGKINDANSKSSIPQSRSISIDQQRLEVMRFLDIGKEGWLPYLAGGVGRLNVSAKPRLGEDDESFADLGVGVMRHINRRFSIRGDLRGIYGFDNKEPEALWTVALMYSLGGGSSAAMPGPEPESDDAPAAAGAGAGAAAPMVEGPKDSDGDGMNDDVDQCDDTEKGAVIDERGCYKETTESVTIDLLLEFDYNKANIREEHKAEIKRVADFMRKFPTTRAILEGHTDSRGSDDYNQALSERRANAVRDYLVSEEGISADRLSATGYGESKPKVENDSAENMQRNRRVAAMISGTSTVRVRAE